MDAAEDFDLRTMVDAAGIERVELVSAAQRASLADQTPEGRSIVEFAAADGVGAGESQGCRRACDSRGLRRRAY